LMWKKDWLEFLGLVDLESVVSGKVFLCGI
jgi:hypothetical protein